MVKTKAQTHQTNYHISDLVHTFSLHRKWLTKPGFIARKPLTYMTVAYNSIILTTLCEQMKQTSMVKFQKITNIQLFFFCAYKVSTMPVFLFLLLHI